MARRTGSGYRLRARIGSVAGGTMIAEKDDFVSPAYAILLYDGVCNLCSGMVRFIVERDPLARFHFVPLQSEQGRHWLRRYGLPEDALKTIVLIEDGRVALRSDAVWRIARHLQGPCCALAALRLVPRPAREAAYGLVARHRYRWFGRRLTCDVPPEDWGCRPRGVRERVSYTPDGTAAGYAP
jgi:predicted DCC family thiol-disulfide oxidoreductase YuxK